MNKNLRMFGVSLLMLALVTAVILGLMLDTKSSIGVTAADSLDTQLHRSRA